MAELKLKILPDLGKLKKDLQDLLKNKFKVGVKGDGAAGGVASSTKKSEGLLGGIFKRLLPLGVLLSIKPVTDILALVLNYLTLGILLLFKYTKKVNEYFSNLPSKIWELIKTGFAWLVDTTIKWFVIIKDKLTNLRDKLVSWLKELPAKIWNFLKELPAKIWEFLKSAHEWFKEHIPVLINKVVTWLINIKEKLKEKLIELKDKFVEKIKELKDKFIERLVQLREKLVAKLIDLKDKLMDKFKEWKDLIKEKFESLIEWVKGLPQAIWDFIKGLPSLIATALKNVLNIGRNVVRSFFSVDDAIIKPNGEVIKTNPNDTIIATQTPNNIGGGKTFNFYGVTPQEMIEVLKRELSEDVNRISRF